jgi:hypothetical protein
VTNAADCANHLSSRETEDRSALIESYDFGRIVIDGTTYSSDIIIMGNKVQASWWRKEGHSLAPSDIEDALERFQPEVVIIGTGYTGMMTVSKETRKYLEAKGVSIFIERTKKACDLFNEWSKSKRTLAGFHLTC